MTNLRDNLIYLIVNSVGAFLVFITHVRSPYSPILHYLVWCIAYYIAIRLIFTRRCWGRVLQVVLPAVIVILGIYIQGSHTFHGILIEVIQQLPKPWLLSFIFMSSAFLLTVLFPKPKAVMS
jgi:hypothetical protein